MSAGWRLNGFNCLIAPINDYIVASDNTRASIQIKCMLRVMTAWTLHVGILG